MDLWTEFEGVTIDSAFSLNRLLQTEGRSAFFSTLNTKGESVLIRLIECHFDEDEILARWRGVQTLGHPNFLCIDRFGQFLIEADEITAVYVVFEHVDANLAQVLERGRLTPAEAAQIGLCVASALETLHANGFVHEHVEARNIFAVGESVKLRSDCIRETPEGAAGLEAHRRDIHNLAIVLMQVLLGAPRSSSTLKQQTLPAPFDDVVRNGMSGEWGLGEIQRALATQAAPKASPPKLSLAKAAPPATSAVLPAAANPAAASPAIANNHELAAKPISAEKSAMPKPGPEPPKSPPSKATASAALPLRRDPMELPVIFGISQQDFRRWVAAGVFFLAVVLFGWIFIHHWFSGHADANALPAPAPSASGAPAQPAASEPHATAALPSVTLPNAAQTRKVWRVVAFTYNRRDQAEKKASLLAQKSAGLGPEVFSPNGRAPWLVTIGGALQRDAAYSLARRARSLGLPRDTYAQNYTAR